MYIIVDERSHVADDFVQNLEREGVSTRCFLSRDFPNWIGAAPPDDLDHVKTFLLGDFDGRAALASLIRNHSKAPIIALSEKGNLQETLALFSYKFDDVIRKPVHVREIIARSEAVWRQLNRYSQPKFERLCVFNDGRDPEIDGTPLLLPRRERDILEYLVRKRGRCLSKRQIFNAIYSDDSDTLKECVVEGHISRLRKKLRQRLGHDPISAKRNIGYSYSGCDSEPSGISK